MEFKQGATIETDDFWYDLFDGGYIKPELLLQNQADIDRVSEAVKVLKEFQDTAENEGVLQWL